MMRVATMIFPTNPSIQPRFCTYHSSEWEVLVETDWITWTVD